jgi:two-component system chemotaxis sensor kinase CheA
MSDSDLMSIFWVEVNEYLDSLNAALLQVEMANGDNGRTNLREMNRVAHSMKGAARAVGLSVIESISHHMEDVFASAMKGELTLTPEICDTLYDGLDLIKNIADGEENNGDTLAEVLQRLEQIAAGGTPAALDAEVEEDEDFEDSIEDDEPVENLVADEEPLFAPESDPRRATPVMEIPAVMQPVIKMPEMLDAQTMVIRPAEETIRVTVSKLDKLMAEASEMLVAKMHGEEQQRHITQLRRVHTRWQREWRNVRAAYIRLVRRLQDQDAEVVTELTTLFKFLESNQRYLTDATRQLIHLGQTMAQDNMHLSTLADQLQDDIGAMRMMPFESIVGGFQRMVRDLGRDTGKHIQLDVVGATVEIDKTVLDALKDPLMHLLRNAIDHGIEYPDEREKLGKSPTGRIELSVEQRGSEIVIRVEDDGHGIDPHKVRTAVVRNKLLTDQEASLVSDEDIRSYIFHPGLSTNERVTELSGRGMGMDIVRDRVESLRGRVSLQSTVGKGTGITLSVPVSLTRIRCILLQVGEEDYAVPSAMVTRMEKIKRDTVFTAEGHEMVEINQRTMPLVSLGAILDVPAPQSAEPKEDVQVVALSAADRAVAFEVDNLSSEMELVLKPLGIEIARSAYVSGAALLGSGDVIIVLDANDLVRRASGAALPRRRTAIFTPAAATTRRVRVLVVDDSITTRTLEKNILETAGFDVQVAIDGTEAWEMLGELEFDVVISDVEMPNMNGLELTRRIKEHSQTRHLPVILLTSLSKPEQREAGLSAGADAYLVKSRFDQGELLETIQAVV